MAIFIPTPEYAYSEVDVTLGGQSYTIEYTFNDIDESWRMSLYTGEGELIIAGIKIMPNALLLRKHALEEFAHGDIACVRLSPNTRRPPTFENLGFEKEYTLVYYTNEELSE